MGDMSPAAAPLEDENLLSEILLRLPPLPSSLPRASAVCKRWRLLVSDPGFVRRFRRRHRRSPPLLGCFVPHRGGVCFTPTMDSPDRVPAGRFCLQLDDSYRFSLLGCRHGLVLISNDSRKQVLVWDPVTGDQHRIAFPPWFDGITNSIHGAVLRAAGEVEHFEVVLLHDIVDEDHFRVIACVYSSEAGRWGNLITLTPTQSSAYCTGMPAVLVGNSFYWRISGKFCAIVEFDLERQSIAVIQVPVD
uniref:F-box domain-containing protein n=1 Tax=Triticum urartu TaxID=4572 RepID=A0A8R7UQR5_TRIUA